MWPHIFFKPQIATHLPQTREIFQLIVTLSVADLGFSPGGGANSQSGCAYLLFLPKTA